MNIKITMRYQVTPIRMAKIKNSGGKKKPGEEARNINWQSLSGKSFAHQQSPFTIPKK